MPNRTRIPLAKALPSIVVFVLASLASFSWTQSEGTEENLPDEKFGPQEEWEAKEEQNKREPLASVLDREGLYGVLDFVPFRDWEDEGAPTESERNYALLIRRFFEKYLVEEGFSVSSNVEFDVLAERESARTLSEAELKWAEEREVDYILYGAYLRFDRNGLGLRVLLFDVAEQKIVLNKPVFGNARKLGETLAELIGADTELDETDLPKIAEEEPEKKRSFPVIVGPVLGFSFLEFGQFPRRHPNQGDGSVFLEGSLGLFLGPRNGLGFCVLEGLALGGLDEGSSFYSLGWRARLYPLWVPIGVGYHLTSGERRHGKDVLTEHGFNIALGFFVWEAFVLSYSWVRYEKGYDYDDRPERILRLGFLRFNIPLSRDVTSHKAVRNGLKWVYGKESDE